MPSIATRTGDDGTTSLLYGQRVPKDHPQIEAVGAFDELNAMLGLAKASCPPEEESRRVLLAVIQQDLVALMGELACAESDLARYASARFPKLGDAALARLDAEVSEYEGKDLYPDGWATPGANPHAAAIEVARAVARRAERRLMALPAHGRTVRPIVRQYANRLCDLLWLMSRSAEQRKD